MSDNVNLLEDPQDLEPSPSPVEESGETEQSVVEEAQPLTAKPESHQVDEQLTEAEVLKKEYRSGLVVGLIMNGIAGCLYSFLMISNVPLKWGDGVWEFGILWLVINFLVLTIFAFRNKKIFEGMVAGLGVAFLIVFVIGAFFTMLCYVQF